MYYCKEQRNTGRLKKFTNHGSTRKNCMKEKKKEKEIKEKEANKSITVRS